MSRNSVYFAEGRKTEVTELQSLLRNPKVQNNPHKKQEVIKKVIAYMTLGYDVSRLFPDIVMAASTNDIVVKKLCYLFMSKYARSNEEVATLCINTMTKDCSDVDPMIRGLALRSLSSLGLISTVQYLTPQIEKGLTDKSSYVRKCAVLAICKFYALSDEAVKIDQGFEIDENVKTDLVNKLYQMMGDFEGDVAISACMVLNEILSGSGGLVVDERDLDELLKRIAGFEEWQATFVLRLVSEKYVVKDESSVLKLFNILDPFLKSNNSALCLSTVECFLKVVNSNEIPGMKNLKYKVLARLLQPMLRMLGSSSPELQYSLLKHILLLSKKFPGVFDDEYRHFYLLFSEPMWNQISKLEILAELCNVVNVDIIVAEISFYAENRNLILASKALGSFPRIVSKVPGSAEGILNQVLRLTKMKGLTSIFCRSCALKSYCQILLDTPKLAKQNAKRLRKVSYKVLNDLKILDDEESVELSNNVREAVRKVSEENLKLIVRLLGYYCSGMKSTGEVLLRLLNSLQENMSDQYRLELFYACTRTYLRQGENCKKVFDQSYKLLTASKVEFLTLEKAKLVVQCLKADPIAYAKAMMQLPSEREGNCKNTELGFNSLSVIFEKNMSRFGTYNGDETLGEGEKRLEAKVMEPHEEENDMLLDFGKSETPKNSTVPHKDNFFHDLIKPEENGHKTMGFETSFSMDKMKFRGVWRSLSPSKDYILMISTGARTISEIVTTVEKALQTISVKILASGSVNEGVKFFIYAKSEHIYLGELLVSNISSKLVVKSEKGSDTEFFKTHLEKVLNEAF
eukprot:snap_masked-scaffold_8-processed-gene-1.26-mRNA-1 protein AED:1.00 eAED:1.00 QI:0/-1/0/0/-1/1/1/0/800